jgi:hypothetical protein
LQVVPSPHALSEEQISELLKKELILRTSPKSGGIWLTQLGVHTKTGHV